MVVDFSGFNYAEKCAVLLLNALDTLLEQTVTTWPCRTLTSESSEF